MNEDFKQLLEVYKAASEIKIAIDRSKADGSFNLKEDFINFTPAIIPVIAALDGIGRATVALDNLTPEQEELLDTEVGRAWKSPGVKKIIRGATLLVSGILDLDDEEPAAPAPSEEVA